MLALFIVVTIAVAAQFKCAHGSASFEPGSIHMWTWSNNVETFGNKFITINIDSSDAIDAVIDAIQGFEMVVLLSAEDRQKMTNCAHVRNALTNAPIQQGINYVYPKETKKLTDALTQEIDATQKVRRMPLPALEQEISQNPVKLNDGKIDVVHALTEDSNFDITSSALLQPENKVLFITVDEPQNFNKAVNHKPLSEGQFSRILATSSSSNMDGIYYKPEGAEYSIYYADTYLYITPDIFTGLMTFLFFTFTALLGVSCLGSIQGMSSFYDKLPVVGKEA